MPSYQPVLAGYTLPYPTTYKKAVVIDGGSERAVNGAVKLSVVNADNRRRWTMAWELITPAEAATLESAWAALRTTSASFTDVLGNTFTVTREPDQDELELEYQPIRNFTDWAISTEMTLLEVLDTD
jgi:hypothetical protein